MCARRLEVSVRGAVGGFALDVALDLELAGVTALFGPSGGGKTTLLRVIAGLERAAGARVAFDGETWADAGRFTPPHRRPVGMVFQDARLFAHLDVAGNLRYADRRSRAAGGGVTLDGVVEALDLGPLMTRRVDALSGGERQRAALARTLLSRPRLLLLDEPLSALDIARKAEILPYLEEAPRRFDVPAIHVSHAVEEVAQIADQVIVLAEGAVQATGPATDVLERLDLQRFTGRFEAGAILDAEVMGEEPEFRLAVLSVAGQTVTMPMARGLAAGERVRLRVRARDVTLATTRPVGISTRNVLAGTVARIAAEPDTAFAEVFVDLGGPRLRARVTRAAVADLGLSPGARVFALIKSAAFDRRALARRAAPERDVEASA